MPPAERVVVDTNKFLDAAHAGKADCLISGDGDLVDLRVFDGIPILTARRYLAQHMVG